MSILQSHQGKLRASALAAAHHAAATQSFLCSFVVSAQPCKHRDQTSLPSTLAPRSVNAIQHTLYKLHPLAEG